MEPITASLLVGVPALAQIGSSIYGASEASKNRKAAIAAAKKQEEDDRKARYKEAIAKIMGDKSIDMQVNNAPFIPNTTATDIASGIANVLSTAAPGVMSNWDILSSGIKMPEQPKGYGSNLGLKMPDYNPYGR